ncbi:pyroglutamyl-peptidase I [Fervidobacterium nodosum]|uniref:Pyrrolidone-carboxylate peptidase n=1 Tax=Fervidobacterium nodosum (strain ATCC 35602 / DSM 5306 / Rt17-B1) TaxID=381764 RepID=A7HLR5_FERNB|nr:pyroglutamyl-peptidase I [Fervidobacterium nodosum]ABS60848.1 Pyroglutamyl-peptidase I [Fervidobacterium nodosum Rt17-B1]PHJ13364.1 peptidase C15 [Fervidobacterium sp. SC_NGM5_G05]
MKDKLFVLITGFEKFGGEKINPSENIIKKIRKKKFDNVLIDTIVLPVSYEKSIKILEEYYSKNQVDVAIHLGQAGGRATINLERVAINLMDSIHPDNDNVTLSDKKIIEDGNDAYMTKIKIKELAEFLNKKNIPTSISYTAGQYICNEVYYFSLYNSEKSSNPKFSLFIHVPFLPQQVSEKYPKNDKLPSMPIQLQFKAVMEVIKNIHKFI